MNKMSKLSCLYIFLFLVTNTFAQHEKSFNDLIDRANKFSEKGDYDEALIMYERAARVVPDTISTVDRVNFYNSLTKKYAFMGMFDEARKRTRELYFQDLEVKNKEYLQIDGSCLLGAYEALEGDYESALDFNVVYLSIVEEYEDISKHCAYRIHALAGKEDQTIQQLQELMAKNPRPDYLLWLTYLLQKKGADAMVAELMPKVNQIKQMAESGKLQGYNESTIQYGLGMIEIIQGDHQKAIKNLRRSYQAGNKQYYWWKNFNPMFDELESYPEFQQLMAEMKSDIDRMRENYLSSRSS